MINSEKPLIATNIDGFLIKHSAFIEPHKSWFEKRIKETQDETLRKWIGAKDYFKGVDIAMTKLMPDRSEEERTKQARIWYQEDVLEYIQENPEIVYEDLANLLLKLKKKYRIALITDSSRQYIDKILRIIQFENVFDIVFSTDISEKPNKASLIEDFIKNIGKPALYISARNKDIFQKMKSLGIKTIYAAHDSYDEELSKQADLTVKSIQELEKAIS